MAMCGAKRGEMTARAGCGEGERAVDPQIDRQWLRGRRILVIGLARSGIAACRVLAGLGSDVTGNDQKGRGDLDSAALDEIEAKDVRLVLGSHDPGLVHGIDLVVLSPGVDPRLTLLEEARRISIPVIGELELGYLLAHAPIVAVTGSNGKSTVTALLGEILEAAGREVVVAGNIGCPLVGEVHRASEDGVIVCEVSSFQLETIRRFRPRIAIILNLTPDHLDRHGSMVAYVDAKARIFSNQGGEDVTILNADDELTANLAPRVPAQILTFSASREQQEGAFVREGTIIVRRSGRERVLMPSESIRLVGPHNLLNSLACVAASSVLGVADLAVQQTLQSFQGLEHRLEFVRKLGGVSYVNDSKATNVDAVRSALESYAGSVVLIAGGRAKGVDFRELRPEVAERVKALILLGEARQVLHDALGDLVETHEVRTMDEAVTLAARLAEPGDTVLLSPSCASFDQFRDFEERGRAFKRAVARLAPPDKDRQ